MINTYHIFGRKDYQEPLSFIAEIEEKESADLKRSVFDSTGGKDWIELIAIPGNVIQHLVREGKTA
ncbi:MAG: hypothetical protein ACE5I1_08055 [bacterium]